MLPIIGVIIGYFSFNIYEYLYDYNNFRNECFA